LKNVLIIIQSKNEDLPHKDMYYFPHRRVQIASAITSIFLSAILLIGAIVCLLSISKTNVKLQIGMILLFTTLFAAVVGLLTNARKAELFGCTAAYAAVLGVFISGSFGSSSS